LPECLEDWADENNPVRVIDAFVEALDLGKLGFARVDPKSTGPPRIIQLFSSSFTSTAISTRCSRAVGWSEKHAAMSR
jgi:hypothetical protein